MASSSPGLSIHTLLMQSGDYSDDCYGNTTDDDHHHADEVEDEYEISASVE